MAWIVAIFGTVFVGLVSLIWFVKFKKRLLESCSQGILDSLGNLYIYVGTQTGNSLKYAEILAKEARVYNFTPHIISLENFQIQEFKRNDFCVIITSTQKDGSPPPNAVQFLKWVTKVAKASHQNLSHLSYCVFGLRKSEETGNATSKEISNALQQLGAHCLVEQGNAMESDYQAFDSWKTKLFRVLPVKVRESRRSQGNTGLLEVALQVDMHSPSSETKYHSDSLKLISASKF